MKMLPVLALVTVLAGCKDRDRGADDSRTPGMSADTIVTKRQVQDTAIITHDTIVKTDTVRRRGTEPVRTDTVR